MRSGAAPVQEKKDYFEFWIMLSSSKREAGNEYNMLILNAGLSPYSIKMGECIFNYSPHKSNIW